MTAGNYCAATCGRCSPAAAAASPSPPPAASPAPAAAPDGTAGAPAPATPGAGCSDVPAPPEAADVVSPVPLSCAEQKAFGKCESPWMVAGNYCAATCGRCGGVAPAPVQSFDGGN